MENDDVWKKCSMVLLYLPTKLGHWWGKMYPICSMVLLHLPTKLDVSHMLHGAATFTYKTGSFMGQNVSHMLHVCYIYLQNWVIYGAHVRKYSMHGASGYVRNMKT